MNELVKKEFEKNVRAINQNFDYVFNGVLSSDDNIKMEFESIRCLIDYCEKLALEGESAIETL